MQQAGQVAHLDQKDALEQSLGQSDGSLPGPEQTPNQSINQKLSNVRCSNSCCNALLMVVQTVPACIWAGWPLPMQMSM